MFAGGKRRRSSSSNVRAMQLFHELKQQFPTVPDHVVTACITAQSTLPSNDTVRQILKTAQQEQQREEIVDEQRKRDLMGQIVIPQSDIVPLQPTLPYKVKIERKQSEEMNNSDYERNNNDEEIVLQSDNINVKRPNYLNLSSDRKLQLSEKCKDVHKLLNSPKISDKPPRSPLTQKKISPKNSPSDKRLLFQAISPNFDRRVQQQKETVSTPTQTTETLLNSPNLNLSLNVNCSMDLIENDNNKTKRLISNIDIIPQQPWLLNNNNNNNNDNKRSFTSVNLTLRTPTTQPQPPIDITSKNSSLTYSTSSFDKEKGLKSCLQITVGPGNNSSVSSIRTRPNSCCFLTDQYDNNNNNDYLPRVRAGSLNSLAPNTQPSILLKQEARIERLRIELKTEKAKLVIMKQEVVELEESKNQEKLDMKIEEQLLKEIKHLRCQCEQLALEVDKKEFYPNIYTGQRGSLLLPIQQSHINMEQQQLDEGPKWNCHLCTFLNHPDLDKCEQCEMPRILHVSAAPGDNIHIHVTPRLSRRIVHSWVL